MKSLKLGILRVRDFLIDWVWQLPQNLIGVILYSTLKRQKVMSTRNNITAVNILQSYSVTSGFTLGKYVFLKDSRYFKQSLKHEIGHVYQSLYLGPLYLLVIGLPSILHYGLNFKTDYYKFYTEKWAEKLYKKNKKEVQLLISELSK